ncbi:hypothetical protein [Halomonas urumqiensis]|uniref:hypothetical protein n=1 Tax=Halomonas urumqiensis TaxID=1684789 RepID=UPI0015E0F2E2|nr:hypothetical protein [Halomonas urumqiensis]
MAAISITALSFIIDINVHVLVFIKQAFLINDHGMVAAVMSRIVLTSGNAPTLAA